MPYNRRPAAAKKQCVHIKRGAEAHDMLNGTQEQVTARLRQLLAGKELVTARAALVHMFKDRPDKIKSIDSIFDYGMHSVFFAMAAKVAEEHEDWASARFYHGMLEVFASMKV